MTDRIFSTDTDAGTITVLEARKGAIREVDKILVGNGPRGPVVFTSSGRGFVTNHAGNTVSEIDPFNNTEVARIKVGSAPLGMGLVPGDKYLLVSNNGDNDISVVDITNRQEIGRISTGREPKHMYIHPTKPFAYVCIWGAHMVSKINIEPLLDADLDRLPNEVKIVGSTFLGNGAHPYSLRVTPDGKYIIVANNQVNYVSIIDEASGEIVKNVDVGSKGSRGTEFSPSGDTVFVSVEDSNEIVAIDLESLDIVERLEAGPGPRGMLVFNNTLFAAQFARSLKVTGNLTTPNTLSATNFGEQMSFRGKKKPQVTVEEIAVGAGPCSISLFSFDG
jgi:YVTN family beta-propeller protein